MNPHGINSEEKKFTKGKNKITKGKGIEFSQLQNLEIQVSQAKNCFIVFLTTPTSAHYHISEQLHTEYHVAVEDQEVDGLIFQRRAARDTALAAAARF